MTGEVAYAASKGALASITKTLADQLADHRITLNTVNPGPVDTGYAPPAAREAVRRHFPQQRWGRSSTAKAACAAGTDPRVDVLVPFGMIQIFFCLTVRGARRRSVPAPRAGAAGPDQSPRPVRRRMPP